jgi:hypothetical protein
VKTIFAGILLIAGGIWARAHFGPIASLCHSGLGGFAQAFSTTARQDCGEAQTAVTLAPWAIGVGILIVAGGVLFALGLLGMLAVSASKKPQAPSGKPRPGPSGTASRPASGTSMPRPAPGSGLPPATAAGEKPRPGPM